MSISAGPICWLGQIKKKNNTLRRLYCTFIFAIQNDTITTDYSLHLCRLAVELVFWRTSTSTRNERQGCHPLIIEQILMRGRREDSLTSRDKNTASQKQLDGVDLLCCRELRDVGSYTRRHAWERTDAEASTPWQKPWFLNRKQSSNID